MLLKLLFLQSMPDKPHKLLIFWPLYIFSDGVNILLPTGCPAINTGSKKQPKMVSVIERALKKVIIHLWSLKLILFCNLKLCSIVHRPVFPLINLFSTLGKNIKFIK